MISRRNGSLALLWAIFAAAGSGMARGQPDKLFAGKTITIVVGYSAGGGYDQYARALARHFGSHIPGAPSVVVENLPGAASLLAVRRLTSNTSSDGAEIAMFDPGLITSSLATPETTKIKLSDYHWVGALARDQRVCYASVASGVKNWSSLMAQGRFMMGATAKGADAYVNGAILRKIFHAPVVQVAGYPGSNEQRLAVERGELEGNCASWASIPPEWIAHHRINVLLRFSQTRPPGLPEDVPFVGDLAKTPEQKKLLAILNAPGELGRPFIVSWSVPAPNLAALRIGFQETLKDPGFISDLQAQSLPLDPISGEDAEARVKEIYREASPAIIQEIKDVLN